MFSKQTLDIAALLQATVVGLGDYRPLICDGVVTDSREVKPRVLFVARKGEKDDGHNYLQDAHQKGAQCFLVSNRWLESSAGQTFVEMLTTENSASCILGVSDPDKAFGELAGHYRAELKIPTIAITGSSGKTTTKEYLRVLLEQLMGAGTASEKSFNNHIGLPQTILKSTKRDRWLLLEAGMNHRGELDYLGQICRPDIAVVLNVGPAHLEFFTSLADIADAKCELLKHVAPGGTGIFNADNQELTSGVRRLPGAVLARFSLKTFGIEGERDYFATNIEALGKSGIRFVFHANGKSAPVVLPLPGRHNVNNALAALAVASTLNPHLSPADLVQPLATVKGAAMRFERVDAGGLCVINDAYNANPMSVKAGLEAVADFSEGTPFGVILGDMLELGGDSDRFHREIGGAVAMSKAAQLIAIGNFAQAVVDGAKESGLANAMVATNGQAAAQEMVKNRALKIVFIKGSRGMAMEKVVAAIIKEANALSSSVLV